MWSGHDVKPYNLRLRIWVLDPPKAVDYMIFSIELFWLLFLGLIALSEFMNLFPIFIINFSGYPAFLKASLSIIPTLGQALLLPASFQKSQCFLFHLYFLYFLMNAFLVTSEDIWQWTFEMILLFMAKEHDFFFNKKYLNENKSIYNNLIKIS